MKKGILEILLFVIVAGIFLWTGMELKDREWKAKVFVQANPPDTTRTIETTPLPEQKKFLKLPPKPTPQHKVDSDSIFAAGMNHGIDSLRSAFEHYTAPMESIVVFDTVGTLWFRSEPLTRMTYFNMQPFPREREIFRIVDSVFVPMPSDQAWYDHWYVGTLGTIVLVFAASQL